MIRNLFVMIAFLLPAVGFAEPKIDIAPMNVPITEGIYPWAQGIFTPGNMNYSPFISCRVLTRNRPDNVMLCMNVSTADKMFPVLGRVSIFVEGNYGQPIGTLLSQSRAVEVQTAGGYELFGYNLKGEDIRRFLNAVREQCARDNGKCLNPEESLFFSTIEAYIDDRFVLVTSSLFPMIYGENTTVAASHELIHALYFRVPEYRERVDEFWRTRVSAADKQAARDAFRGVYDISSEYVVINEFQAYVLGKSPEEGLILPLATKYRSLLMNHLGSLAPAEYQF